MIVGVELESTTFKMWKGWLGSTVKHPVCERNCASTTGAFWNGLHSSPFKSRTNATRARELKWQFESIIILQFKNSRGFTVAFGSQEDA